VSEPSEDFDWDQIDRDERETLALTSEQERAAVERGARAFASLVLLSDAKPHPKQMRASFLRIAVAVYLLRLPGWERYQSMAQIGRSYGVTAPAIRRIAVVLSKALGLPSEIQRTHGRSTKRALKK